MYKKSEIMGAEAEGAQQRSGIVSAKILLFLQTLPVLIAEIKKTSWIHNIIRTTERKACGNLWQLTMIYEDRGKYFSNSQ